MLRNETGTKMRGEDAPVRFLRREWKRNKPHLQRSSSDPALSLLPTTRPRFTCQQCGFINTQIPICLWCCWTSKESEKEFEESMPRPRRVSAPMRVQSSAERRNKEHARTACQCVTDAVAVTCQNSNGQDQSAGSQHSPGFSSVGNAEPTGSIRLALHGGPRRNSHIRVNQTDIQTRRSPGLSQVNNRPSSSLGDIGDGIDNEVDLHPCRSEWAGNGKICEGSNLTRKDGSKDPEQDPMSSLLSSTRPTAKRPGMMTFGDVSANGNVLITIPPPKAKERPLLPLRFRRLKGVATPLYIDSTAQPSMTNVIASASSPTANIETTTTTAAPSPASVTSTPRTLRRKSHLKIFRSFSTDDDSAIDVKSDIRVMTNAESSTNYARRPKSDPFGDVLRPKNIPPPLPTPDSLTTQTPTRLRAVTTSALSQLHSPPSTPALSARSGPISPIHPKPLYSAIRKNGVCLSPPLPSPSYTTTSAATSPIHSSGKVNEYSAGHGYGYASPASSIFPLYPPAADTMLLSLSLESRPSSSSTSSSSSDQQDVFGPLMMLRAKCGCRYKRKSKSGSKTKSKRRDDKARSKEDQGRLTSRGNMRSSMPMAGMESSPAYQRMVQVPVGMGCSMSGETELKLALARRDKTASTPMLAADTNEPCSPSSKPGKAMRRLREMVSRTF